MTERPIVSAGASTSLIPGVIRAVRPKQWAKNALVFIAPGAAGVLTDARPLGYAGLGSYTPAKPPKRPVARGLPPQASGVSSRAPTPPTNLNSRIALVDPRTWRERDS